MRATRRRRLCAPADRSIASGRRARERRRQRPVASAARRSLASRRRTLNTGVATGTSTRLSVVAAQPRGPRPGRGSDSLGSAATGVRRGRHAASLIREDDRAGCKRRCKSVSKRPAIHFSKYQHRAVGPTRRRALANGPVLAGEIHRLTPLNSSRPMRCVRRRDDNSRKKVQNVGPDSLVGNLR